jgi:hypothetical protein
VNEVDGSGTHKPPTVFGRADEAIEYRVQSAAVRSIAIGTNATNRHVRSDVRFRGHQSAPVCAVRECFRQTNASASHRRYRLDDLCEISQRPGPAIDLVDDRDVDKGEHRQRNASTLSPRRNEPGCLVPPVRCSQLMRTIPASRISDGTDASGNSCVCTPLTGVKRHGQRAEEPR